MPNACPPQNAEDPPCTVYRALDADHPCEDDFLSWVQLGHPSAKPTNCKHWGLSVWMSIEAVEHARDVVTLMKRKYIAEGQLVAGDGKVMATPTRPQPEHCTLWPCTSVDIKHRFTVVMEPEDA